MVQQGHAPQKPVRRKLHPESLSATPPLTTPYSAATLTKSTQRSVYLYFIHFYLSKNEQEWQCLQQHIIPQRLHIKKKINKCDNNNIKYIK